MDTTRLDGAIALVTGANGDIGSAVCTLLEARGATVLRSDLRAPEGVGDGFLPLDVTSEESWTRTLAAIESRHGALDILVNNAGIAPMERIDAMTLEDWRRCQQVNVEGVFLGLKLASALLARSGGRREGGAAIVNLCSGASDRPSAFSAAYCVSKAAARMLTRVAAVEFAALKHPIRVNSVHPGVVESAMMDDILATYSRITGGTPVETLRAASPLAIRWAASWNLSKWQRPWPSWHRQRPAMSTAMRCTWTADTPRRNRLRKKALSSSRLR
ncbi:MAG: hypothetical protein K0R64_3664 [Novosphingobium lindaniclasticum]|nr:hypothetical protein [Novosphingobium lindaniclasticum]